MAVIMALDIGERTIGTAFTDPLGTMAFPGETILRSEGLRRDMAKLRSLIADRSVSVIVIGVPLMADGSVGPQAERVEQFIGRLRGSVRIPIERIDETHTTAEAASRLAEAGRRRSERKRTIDSAAACLMLEEYLARKADPF